MSTNKEFIYLFISAPYEELSVADVKLKSDIHEHYYDHDHYDLHL